MTTHPHEARLRSLIGEVAKTDLDTIGLDDDVAASLGLDSLAGLRLLAAVEKGFAIQFPDELLSELRTLRKLLAAIDEAKEEQA